MLVFVVVVAEPFAIAGAFPIVLTILPSALTASDSEVWRAYHHLLVAMIEPEVQFVLLVLLVQALRNPCQIGYPHLSSRLAKALELKELEWTLAVDLTRIRLKGSIAWVDLPTV